MARQDIPEADRCTRCSGHGLYDWREKCGVPTKITGHSDACFQCQGTGKAGTPRIWRGRRRNGSKPAATHAPAPQATITITASEEPTPMLRENLLTPDLIPDLPPIPARKPNGHASQDAAAHLAAALAALTAAQEATPQAIDADAVRAIARQELGAAGNEIYALLARRQASIDALLASVRGIIDGIPRRIEIVTPTHTTTLPDLHHQALPDLIQWLAINVPVYLVGPAGAGKTMGAEMAADALGFPFYMQGAASGAHEYTGYMDATGNYHGTPFRQAFEHGGVCLLDEIDASAPDALLVINAAVSNGRMAFPDSPTPVKRHANFRLIAAANTFGQGADRQYVGRSQLDGATLDRFAFIAWDYDASLERAIAGDTDWTAFVRQVRAAIAKLNMRVIVSPRASIHGSKALAAGMDRDAVERSLIWRGMTKQDEVRIRDAMREV